MTAPLPPLRERFQQWHRDYRGPLGELMVAGVLSGGLVYGENKAIAHLTESLTGTGGVDRILRTALLLLVVLVALRLVRVFIGYWQSKTQTSLEQRARADLERDVLSHLLRKDEAFFGKKSPGEIVNRLSSDIGRAVSSRAVRQQIAASVFVLAGNVIFFFQESWELAVTGIATVALGVVVTARLTGAIQSMDRGFLERDDRVKGRFEDFLHAVAEIQVGNLHHDVRERFVSAQHERRVFHDRFTRFTALMSVVQGGSYLLSLVSLLVLAIFVLSGAEISAAAALVPVVFKALPELFASASSLPFHRVALDRSRTSQERLLEFESEDAEAPDGDGVTGGAAPIRVEGATYRYPGKAGGQGGVADVTTTIEADRWTAIVGGSGSGKSTLLQLLLGRVAPQEGSVLYGEQPLAAMSRSARASILSLMPQKSVLFDATVEENLTFGRAGAAATDEDLELVERVGLGDLLRLRALDLPPSGDALDARVVALRREARELARAAGVDVHAYEEPDSVDPTHFIGELLLSSRVDRSAFAAALSARAHAARLRAVAGTALGRSLSELADGLLQAQERLLALPTYAAYARLASPPASEEVFRIRQTAARGGRRSTVELVKVALTASPFEMGEVGPAAEVVREARRELPDEWRAFLSRLVLEEPLDEAAIHPRLTLRENLVFGALRAQNQRAAQEVDQRLVALLVENGVGRALARVGLGFAVGKGGARLSGGQRQLIALCRTLLRRTPVVVLDEPTSALDPSSRARVVEVLREWKEGRVVVTVSHDPELIREADEVRLLGAGRLIASGPFAELAERSADLRATLRLR